MATAPAGHRAPRSWPQRLFITINAILIAVCLTAVGGVGYLWYRFGQLPRVQLSDGVLAVQGRELARGEGSAPARGQVEIPDTQNWLLVGSDTRAFVAGEADAGSFGTEADSAGQRADTIIILRVDPRTQTAAMLSIPRDLWVLIAGTGESQRINTAFEQGPERLILTIRENFGIPIHHYAQVDFAGFQDLVDAVGGVEMYFASPARDRMAGLDIPQAGCVELNGEQALAFVRSRHYQYQENGRWRTDQSGDIGRITRQQDFIRRAIRETMASGFTNPVRLNELVGVAIENVTLDERVDAGDLLTLGRRFRALDPASIEMMTLPTVADVTAGGAAILRLLEEEAQPILDRFRGVSGAPAADVRPEQVQVRVLNGTGVAGQAGQVAAALEQASFAVAGVGDGTLGTGRTTIRYAPGEEAKAHFLARWIEGGAVVVEAPGQLVDLELVTGADFVSVLDAPSAAAPSAPPTTAPAPPAPDAPEEAAGDGAAAVPPC